VNPPEACGGFIKFALARCGKFAHHGAPKRGRVAGEMRRWMRYESLQRSKVDEQVMKPV